MNIIKRIYESYDKELEDYKKQPKEYGITGIWTVLAKARFSKDDLFNFGSSKIGNGLSLLNATLTPEKAKKIGIMWFSLTDKLPIKVLEYPQKFGFIGITVRGKTVGNIFTIVPAFRLSYYAKRISDLINGNVVEIGGGFGGVPYHLFKDFKFNKTYLNFDIPRIGLIAKYFLMNVFPKKRFLLYGEDDIKNFQKYDIVLMPHYVIKDLPDNCCDMAFNAHGLSEMGKETIDEYLKQVDRISTKYFLHFNHAGQAFFIDVKTEGVDRNNLVDLSNINMPGWKKIYKFIELLLCDDDSTYFEWLYEK